MKPRLKSAKARDRAATIQHILQMLHKWGIHTLGEFAALDKEQIGLRLGPEAIHLWERAQGKTTRLLKLTLPLESFEETFEFENEIETTEPLLFMLRRFLQQLSRRLGALYLVTKELTLRLTFWTKAVTSDVLKSRNRQTTSKFFSGCCTRISNNLSPNARSSLFP